MSFSKKSIRDIDMNGKRVVVRAMLNVPIKDGQVSDKRRLDASKPTLDYLLTRGASVVLISHHSNEGQSLEPVVSALSEVLGTEVGFVNDCIGSDAEAAVNNLQPGHVLILENLRFHPEEEANDEAFAKQLADHGDIFVQDDFTTAHRKHASMVGIPKFLPAVAGLQIEKEVETITGVLESPRRPLVAIVGGAKISTKIPIINTLLGVVDTIFVGGAMANTFFLAQSKPVGKSLVEADQVETARKIIREASSSHKKLLLPLDLVVTTDIDSAANVRTIELNEVGEDDIIVDIGPQSVDGLERILSKDGTVIWNGPVGISEQDEFAGGTKGVAEAIIDSGAYSLVGGGDTTDYVDRENLGDKFSFVSTGGGASLELFSGNTLPGVEALLDKDG
jgi:phosphoglycerate kinase